MGTVRKTITLTDQQDAWVKAQINGGGYTNDSELIRDLIRREQQRTAEIELIRQALIEGEKSGEPQAFDAEGFKGREEAGLPPGPRQAVGGTLLRMGGKETG